MKQMRVVPQEKVLKAGEKLPLVLMSFMSESGPITDPKLIDAIVARTRFSVRKEAGQFCIVVM